MNKYRKRPVVIEAMQYDGSPESFQAIYDWSWGGDAAHAPIVCEHDEAPGRLYIDTREGTMRADPGDWIIRGVQGEYYPIKPDIFEATYEPVDEHEERKKRVERDMDDLRKRLTGPDRE